MSVMRFTLAAAYRIRGASLDKNRVAAALAVLRTRHPYLRMALRESSVRSMFVPSSDTEIPLIVHTLRPTARLADVRLLAEQVSQRGLPRHRRLIEAHAVFPARMHAAFAAHSNEAGEEEDEEEDEDDLHVASCFVILAVDHSICDARSLFVLGDDLLEFLAQADDESDEDGPRIGRPLAGSVGSQQLLDWFARLPPPESLAPCLSLSPIADFGRKRRCHPGGFVSDWEAECGGGHSMDWWEEEQMKRQRLGRWQRNLGDDGAHGIGFRGESTHYTHENGAQWTVPRATTQRFVAAASDAGASVWSTLQAIVCLIQLGRDAEQCRTGQEQKQEKDSCVVVDFPRTDMLRCVVDIRQRLVPRIALDSVCSPVSVVQLEDTVYAKDSLWDVAKRYKRRLQRALDEGEPLARLQHMSVGDGTVCPVNNYGDIDRIRRDRRGGHDRVDVGDTDDAGGTDETRWDWFHLIVNDGMPESMRNRTACVCWTMHGKLTIAFPHAPAFFRPRTIAFLATQTNALLCRLADGDVPECNAVVRSIAQEWRRCVTRS